MTCKPTAYRLSPEELKMLAKLAKDHAVSRRAMLEVLIRAEFNARKVKGEK
jgi:hypothetical protein